MCINSTSSPRRGAAYLLAMLAFGCSATGTPNGTSGAAAAPGVGGTGAIGVTGGAGGTAASGGLLDAGSSGGGLGDASCAADSYTAEQSPVDLALMVDQSGSMSDHWVAVTGALKTFVQAKTAAGLGVGIAYFPVVDTTTPCNPCGAGCSTCINGCCPVLSGPCDATCTSGVCVNNQCGKIPADSCNLADYSTPDVPIAVLPGNEAAIVSSLNARTTKGGTPTAPALEGAISYARSFNAQNLDHKVSVVFATDGIPTSCTPEDIPSIAAIAAAAAAESPPILTYVIGVGSETADLNAIAVAGGTKQAFFVDTNLDAGKQFLDALDAIRNTAFACEYSIPLPTSGQLDFGRVNVQRTPSGGSGAPIPQVPDASKCDPGGGWYYDDPANPTRILICPSSCDELQNDLGGKLDILLGCQTIIK